MFNQCKILQSLSRRTTLNWNRFLNSISWEIFPCLSVEHLIAANYEARHCHGLLVSLNGCKVMENNTRHSHAKIMLLSRNFIFTLVPCKPKRATLK